jgi:hypothetical protein
MKEKIREKWAANGCMFLVCSAGLDRTSTCESNHAGKRISLSCFPS